MVRLSCPHSPIPLFPSLAIRLTNFIHPQSSYSITRLLDYQIHQSLYLVPSRAVPSNVVYTSNTFCPPHRVESGLSWYDRLPHAMSCVIGSIGTFRRNFSLRP